MKANRLLLILLVLCFVSLSFSGLNPMGFSKTSSVNYDADQDSSDLQTSQISTQPSVPSSTLIHPSSKPVSTSTKPVSTLQSTCVNIDIIPGQNYVSIPYSLSDMSVSSLFPKMKVYNYDNGWKVKTGNVNVGEPLMVISTSAHELSFCGQPQEVCYDLKQGWNVIGAPYEKMTTQQFETEYGITSVYSYENQKYVLENEIVPGHVYWIEIKDVSTSPTSICFGVMESAECDITTCTNITTSGYHALCTDIDATDYMGTHDACIDIQANDVELDGNGYSITGAGEGKGILVNGFDNSNIHDCGVYNFGKGIFLLHNSNNTLTSNTANSNNIIGIDLQSSGNILNNNIANSNNLAGIYLIASSDNNTLSNNTANFNTRGIDIYRGSNNNLYDNTVNSNTQHGIHIRPNSNGNALEGNTANSNYECGIYLSSSSNNTLTNNIANSNNWTGIRLSSSSNNTLTNNIANSNNWTGIRLSSSSNNIFTNNTAYGNNDYGIRLSSCSNTTLTNNIVSSNVEDGIYLYRSFDNILTNNTATSNNEIGINLSSSSNNTLTNNIANSNNWTGIRLSSSSNNTLTSNTANSNENDGIFIYSSSNNIFTNNTANSNYEIGISLSSSSNNTITDNTANSNDYGISLSSSSNNVITNNTAYGNNDYGIVLYSSFSNTLTDNTACSNINFDIFKFEASTSNTFSLNTCDTTYPGEHDDYCAYTCDEEPECDITECTTITTPGYHALCYNIDASEYMETHDACIDIQANDVELDGNGYSITGADTGKGILVDIFNNLNIYDCGVYHFSIGIHLESSSSNTLTNNTVNSNLKDGIQLTYSSSNNTFTNNTVNLNGWRGININYCSNNVLISNNIYSNGMAGILIYGDSYNNTLIENIASLNERNGIILMSGPENNILVNNTAISNAGNGISNEYSSFNNTFTNNAACSNEEYDFYEEGPSDDNTFSENTCQETSPGAHDYYCDYNCVEEVVGTCDILDKWITLEFVAVNDSTHWTGREGEYTTVAGMTVYVESVDILIGSASPCATCPVLDETATFEFTLPAGSTTWTGRERDSTMIDGILITVESIDEILTVAQPCVEEPECDITECTVIDRTGYHALCNNIDATEYMETHDTCIDIQANDVELDGNGYSITDANTEPLGAGSSQGILLLNSNNSYIHDCNVYDFYNGISFFGGSSNNLITGNTFSSNTHKGINLLFNANNNILTNNIVNLNYYGISIKSSHNNTVIDNVANSNTLGIYLSISYNNILMNNIANENEKYGIYLCSDSINNTITNNIANYNNQYGIFLKSGSDNNFVSNNIANENRYFGINLDLSSNNILINNSANSNLADGINIGVEGTSLRSSHNNTLINNTANLNSRYGIYIAVGSKFNNLTSNTANSNRFEGFIIRGGSNNTLTNNIANFNGYDGIYLDQSYNNSVTGNTAYSNGKGIVLYQCLDNLIIGNTACSNIRLDLYHRDPSPTNIFMENICTLASPETDELGHEICISSCE